MNKEKLKNEGFKKYLNRASVKVETPLPADSDGDSMVNEY